MNQYQIVIDYLLSFSTKHIWVHEKVVYSMLPILVGKSKQAVISKVTSSLQNQKGYIGNRNDNL